MIEYISISEMWEILKVYIPEKEKQGAADHFIQYVVDLDMPAVDFNSLVTSDQYLEEAAGEYVENEDEEEGDDEEHADW